MVWIDGHPNDGLDEVEKRARLLMRRAMRLLDGLPENDRARVLGSGPAAWAFALESYRTAGCPLGPLDNPGNVLVWLQQQLAVHRG